MVNVGIEKIDFYGGACQIEVSEIFRQRELNIDRYANLLMNKKSVGLPFEDAVTNGVTSIPSGIPLSRGIPVVFISILAKSK